MDLQERSVGRKIFKANKKRITAGGLFNCGLPEITPLNRKSLGSTIGAMSESPVVPVPDDGLICPEVGSWAETKHALVSLYTKLFATGMKNKWDKRTYIELYAGAGCSKIRGKGTRIAGSPLRALCLEDPFDKYIFCEQDAECLAALKKRVKLIAPSADVSYVPGDCNQCVDEILAAMPQYSRECKVLSLCFVDPFNIGIKFETLRRLSAKFVDFLVLLALYMDANRNRSRYIVEDQARVDEFLGSTDWRVRWKTDEQQGILFPNFLKQEFTNSMETLDYAPPPLYKMKAVRSDDRNLPLYHLALFSRHKLAYEFWDQAMKYHTDQTSFAFEE